MATLAKGIHNELHSASIAGNLFNIKNLIEKHGIDPNGPDDFGQTPLYYAVLSGDLMSVLYLIEKARASINAVNIVNITPLAKALLGLRTHPEQSSTRIAIIEVLVRAGAKICVHPNSDCISRARSLENKAHAKKVLEIFARVGENQRYYKPSWNNFFALDNKSTINVTKNELIVTKGNFEVKSGIATTLKLLNKGSLTLKYGCSVNINQELDSFGDINLQAGSVLSVKLLKVSPHTNINIAEDAKIIVEKFDKSVPDDIQRKIKLHMEKLEQKSPFLRSTVYSDESTPLLFDSARQIPSLAFSISSCKLRHR